MMAIISKRRNFISQIIIILGYAAAFKVFTNILKTRIMKRLSEAPIFEQNPVILVEDIGFTKFIVDLFNLIYFIIRRCDVYFLVGFIKYCPFKAYIRGVICVFLSFRLSYYNISKFNKSDGMSHV